MKIILSRKGFDSANGGVPSPIFEDGTMISLPIPAMADAYRMGDLTFNGISLGELSDQLSKGAVTGDNPVHLDPDLNRSIIERPSRWMPAFGQSGAAQTHLANKNVEIGDLFLFFGWFRRVELKNGRYRYVKMAPNIHVIYGWLQIGGIWNINADRNKLLQRHPECAMHAHVSSSEKYSNRRNTLYTPTDKLDVKGLSDNFSGAGAFSMLSSDRILTKTGKSRRNWRLPRWLHPEFGKAVLSYHSDHHLWTHYSDHVELKSAAIGQEFVLSVSCDRERGEWVKSLFGGQQRDADI